jgi:hypothetical protein
MREDGSGKDSRLGSKDLRKYHGKQPAVKKGKKTRPPAAYSCRVEALLGDDLYCVLAAVLLVNAKVNFAARAAGTFKHGRGAEK